MIAKCGDNCICCARYLATQSGDIKELEKVKDLWVRLGLRTPDFPVRNMVCYGCRPENKCAYPEICSCVSTKGIENCGFCDEYPCKRINEVFARSDAFESQAEKVCSPAELEMLRKAFFSKKAYFDHIHQKHRMKV